MQQQEELKREEKEKEKEKEKRSSAISGLTIRVQNIDRQDETWCRLNYIMTGVGAPNSNSSGQFPIKREIIKKFSIAPGDEFLVGLFELEEVKK